MTRVSPVRPGALLAILLGLLLLCPSPARALSDEKAVDLMTRVYEKALKVTSFQSEFNLIRQDPRFMELFFPESEFFSNLNIRGVVNYDSATTQYNLYFRIQGVDYQHFTSKGMSVVYLAPERIYNFVKDPKPTRIEPSPSPSPTEMAAPSPSPSPSPRVADLPFKDLTPQSNRPVLNHPLAFMWPYVLRGPDPTSQYRLLSEKEPVYGRNCALIEVKGSGPGLYRLAVDPSVDQIIQIQVVDPDTGDVLQATYTGFYPPDPKTGFAMYNRLQVDAGNRPVFMAELVSPTINPNQVMLTGPSGPTPSSGRPDRGARNEDIGTPKPVFTAAIIFLVLVLSGALGFLGYRYVRFAVSRQEFSDELVLIDEEDGRFSELLRRLGCSVVPFSPEVLTNERNLLGKGATADTTQRPRGVVVAPESFGEVKGYFFLLKAYVHEGGRVLVMYHSPKSSVQMPFTSTFIPLSAGDSATVYDRKNGAFPSLEEEEAERLASVLAAKELYTQVNDRPVDQELLVARNKTTGVKGAVVGVVRQGKGEYILCQLRFDPRNTLNSKAARSLLKDLLAFLQARSPAAREEAAAGVR